LPISIENKVSTGLLSDVILYLYYILLKISLKCRVSQRTRRHGSLFFFNSLHQMTQ